MGQIERMNDEPVRNEQVEPIRVRFLPCDLSSDIFFKIGFRISQECRCHIESTVLKIIVVQFPKSTFI